MPRKCAPIVLLSLQLRVGHSGVAVGVGRRIIGSLLTTCGFTTLECAPLCASARMF
jgi:hypothetical protein